MQDDPTPPVEEAEIVSEAKNSTPQTIPFDINAFNATLEVVRRRIGVIETSKAELKKLKEMHNDMFVNDASYNEADKVVKDVLKKRKDIEAHLNQQPGAQDVLGKMKDLKEQIKDNEESLSQELMEYYKTAGVTEIEDADGNVQEFAIVIKLKGKKKAE